MFDSLGKSISQVENKTDVELREFYDTISLIESLCPEIWESRMKTNTKKAARVLWMRWLVGREIVSSKQLYGDEMWLIHAFITGVSGAFTEDMDEDWQAMNASANQAEFVQWCIKYQVSIRKFADQIIAPKEKKKQKAYRKRKKAKSNEVPF